MKKIALLISFITILFSCNSSSKKEKETVAEYIPTIYDFTIEELTDIEYPDNPDIGYRATTYNSDYFTKGKIETTDHPYVFNMSFYAEKDSIQLHQINLKEFVPTIPNHIKQDQYLSFISIINQEWNRNQVSFTDKEFSTSDVNITRIDVARNCLNSYLWEIIAYTVENDVETPICHGWFTFPKKLYQQLFEAKNEIPFAKYEKSLEYWKDPTNEYINPDDLRTVIREIPIEFKDSSDEMYPLEKGRKKKFKEIIHPVGFKTMKDLQSDKTSFATFTPPGFYNKADPRKTELGRIFNLKEVKLSEVSGKKNQQKLHEVKLIFTDQKQNRTTKLIIGGIDFKNFPQLISQDANDGWKSSMGIGNHTFYEKYNEHLSTKSADSPYYAYLTNEKDQWIDSHTVGIDGPIFHYDAKDPKKLHLWLLSFERHALVGHYIITILQ